MIEVEVKVDTSRFERMMSDMPDALARARRNALEDVGKSIARIARDSFIKDTSLRPSPWAPRKDKKKHALLLRSTVMWGEIKSRVVGEDTVRVGTSAPYAKYHQLGTKKMPARPFFPVDKYGNLTPVAQREVTHKIEKAFADELRRLGGQ